MLSTRKRYPACRMHPVFDPNVLSRLTVGREHRVSQVNEVQVFLRRHAGFDHLVRLAGAPEPPTINRDQV